jgi:hypothetical protein
VSITNSILHITNKGIISITDNVTTNSIVNNTNNASRNLNNIITPMIQQELSMRCTTFVALRVRAANPVNRVVRED